MGNAKSEAEVLEHMACVFQRQGNIGPASASNWTQEKVKALDAIDREITINSILDLGIGDMCVMEAWPIFGEVNYIGVDGCAPILDRARARHPDHLFIQAPMSQLVVSVLRPDAFDLVTIFDVLYHIQDDALHSDLLDYVFEARKAVALTYATKVQDFGGQHPGESGFAWFPRPEVAERVLQEIACGWRLVYESEDFNAGHQKQRLVALVRS